MPKKPTKDKVVCFNCKKIIPKNKAFYIVYYDTYLCESCYRKLLEGKRVKLSNWRKRGA